MKRLMVEYASSGLSDLELRVGEVELRLFGVWAERKARDQALERARRQIVVVDVNRVHASLIQLRHRQRIQRIALLAAMEQGTAGQRDHEDEQYGTQDEATGKLGRLACEWQALR